MLEFLISPFLAGLSVGLYCFSYCLPFIAPFMVAQEGTNKKNLSVLLRFITGRFFGYASFGILIGYLGEKINGEAINLALSVSLMLLSITLFLHAVGLLRADKSALCARLSAHSSKFPLIMGFLMGINICPPFLMSLTYVLTLHSMLKGLLYFVMFFLGTSIYFLPFFFLGLLNKMKEFQLAGRVGAIVVSSLFFIYSVYSLASRTRMPKGAL